MQDTAADPGFAFRGANSPSGCGNLLFCKFFAKNCMKMKEFGPRKGEGGRSVIWSDTSWKLSILSFHNNRIIIWNYKKILIDLMIGKYHRWEKNLYLHDCFLKCTTLTSLIGLRTTWRKDCFQLSTDNQKMLIYVFFIKFHFCFIWLCACFINTFLICSRKIPFSKLSTKLFWLYFT